MKIPTKCNLPDLSDLEPLRARLLVRLLVGDSILKGEVGLYFREYIRLVEKALYEYDQARNVLIEVVKETNYRGKNPQNTARLSFAFEFPNHMETCINAIRRLFQLQEGITRAKKELVLIPRDVRKAIKSYFDTIKNIRDAIEHLDEKINLQLFLGKPIMLSINDTGDGMIILNNEIKFTELSAVLRSLYQIALQILEREIVKSNII